MWDWGYAWQILPDLLAAAVITIEATILGFAVAAVLGLVLAILRMSQNPWISNPITGFIEFVRGTPVLIQIFFMFYVLPRSASPCRPCSPGAGARAALRDLWPEVYRAGLENIPRGQWEAAMALNLTPQTFKDVIIPQAIPPVVPALGNYFIAMFKETPLLSAIAVVELMQTAKILGSLSFRYLEPITLVGALLPDHEPGRIDAQSAVRALAEAPHRRGPISMSGGLAPNEPMVRFQEVTKRYGALTVLDELDLDVAPNEKVAIIGPSGSGKTTVLRMLMTLETDRRRRDLGRRRAAHAHAAERPAGARATGPSAPRARPRSAWSSSTSICSRT